MRPHNQSKLLFIDDDREIINAYANIFKRKQGPSLLSKFVEKGEKQNQEENSFWDKFHFETDFALNGIAGVDKIKAAIKDKDPFQVVFVDMRMPPGINGTETARRIRQIDSAVEIVIITAYSDFSTDEINTVVGHPDKLIYVKKPFYTEEIKQIALNLTEKYKNERSKENFILNVSHELRTPLASILGFTKLLLDAKTLQEEEEGFVRTIRENSGLLQCLVEELIASVQMKQEGMMMDMDTVNPIPIVKSAVRSFIPLFDESREVELVDKIEDMDLEVEWDVFKIKQSIINLINNAKKFTSKGRIEISCFLDGEGKFVVTVKDSGIGIPEDKIETIFDRFYRLENSHHNVEGLGLGLSIVKDIVLKHGGDVQVESKLGVGSTFSLKFDKVA